MIPRRMVPQTSRHATQQRLFRPTKVIKIHGLVPLRFKIESVLTAATLLGSEHIEEMILDIE